MMEPQEQQSLIKEINISTFVSPYMFWFTYKGFIYESKLKLVEAFLKKHYENRNMEKDPSFILGEVLCALHFYAHGSYQKSVGQDFFLGLSQTSVSRCIKSVSHIIYEHLGARYMQFPNNEERREALKIRFMERFNFPGVIGCIDCTHVAIVSPPLNDDQHPGYAYLNRKGYHSINVQLLVVVFTGNKWARATLECIHIDDQENKVTYSCWLVDYGTMLKNVSSVHQCDEKYHGPFLAKQACLNKVVFTAERLDYSEASTLFVKVKNPSVSARRIAFQIVLQHKTLKFVQEDECCDILFGDLLFPDGDQSKSLRDHLVDLKMAVVDEEYFKATINYETLTDKTLHVDELPNYVITYEEDPQTGFEFENIEVNDLSPKRSDRCSTALGERKSYFKNAKHEDSHINTVPVNQSKQKQNLLSKLEAARKNSSLSLTHDEMLSTQNTTTQDSLVSCTESSSPSFPTQPVSTLAQIKKKILLNKRKSDEGNLIMSPEKVDETKSNENDIKKSSEIRETESSVKGGEKKTSKQMIFDIISKRKNKYQKAINDSIESDSDFDRSDSSISKHGPLQPEAKLETCDLTLSKMENNQSREERLRKFKGIDMMPAGASYSCQPKSKKATNLLRTSQKSGDSSLSESELKPKNCTSSKSSDTKDETESDSKTNEFTRDTIAGHKKSLVNDMKITPQCSCKDCDFWTHSSGWDSNDASKKKIVTSSVSSTRPLPLLLKTPELLTPSNIKSIEYNKMTKMEILSRPNLLVHGRLLPAPMSSIAEADLAKGILESLKYKKYTNLIKAQKYSWPAIMNGSNVCVVNRPNTGKMFAYLPPLCSLLMDHKKKYKDLAKFPGPVVLIVCPNSTKCQEVYDKICIYHSCPESRVNCLTMTYPVTSLKSETVDILITIPSVLIFLLQANVVTLKRLCYLVFDCFDMILNRFKTNIHQLLDVIETVLERRHIEIGVQLIATCETWTLDVEEIMKRLSNVPFIIIGNPLEAALYGRVDLNMQFLQKSMKPSKLVDILKGKYKVFKTVVICRQDEMDELAVMLRLEGIDLLVVSGEMDKTVILDLETKWNSLVGGTYIVLLCTDECLNTTLTVTDATLVVHYCLPESWTIFVKRFNCFLDVIKSPFINQEKQKLNCESYILTDESCIKQIPKFIKFLQRMKQELPQNFTNFLSQSIHSQEKRKVTDKVPLCDNLKLLGKCQMPSCDSRHILNRDLDQRQGYPQNGRIKFKIRKLKDVTNYAAVLLEHVSDKGVVSKFNLESDLSSDLTNFMNLKKIPTINLQKGWWYTYHEIVKNQSIYHRCEVLRFHEDKQVTIKLLDHCRELRAPISCLFELPEKFHELPVTVVDIYVACMVPPFEDDGFSHYSFRSLQKYLSKLDYGEMTLSADIYLQLGSTFWLKNIVEEMVIDSKVLIKFNLSKKLQDWQLVSLNQDQLNNLYSLCKEANMELPCYFSHKEKVVKKHEEQIKPQWAFLDEARAQDVTFAAAVSPNEFYVRLNKFENLLIHLQEEIQDLVKKPFNDRQISVKAGKCFLAKDEESQEYCRVQILKVKDNRASCFFVDYGDERSVNIEELKYIPNHIISKLPFQAVRCRLYGVKPSLDDWQDEATDILYNYAFEPDSQIYRELYVKTCLVEKMGLTRKKYAVLLKEGYSSKCTLLNNLLIDCGFAIPNENEAIIDFEIPQVVEDSDSMDSDVEEVLDILRKTTQVQDNRICLPGPIPQDHQNSVNPEDEFDFVTFDMKGFVEQLQEFGLQTEPMERPIDTELSPIRVAPVGKYCTPPVIWSQTESTLTITIRIAYINEDFSLNLSKGRLLKFRATVNEKDYALKLILLKDVESTFQHSVVGSDIRIRMKKIEEVMWPKLVTGNVKLRNITYDFSSLKVEDDDENRKKFLDLGDIDDLYPEGEDDSDDDLHYVNYTDSDSDAEFKEFDSDLE